MTIGLGLLKSILQYRRPLSILEEELHIEEKMFHESEKKVFDYIKNHFLSYSEMPNIRTVEIECKINLEPFENEPPGYWADRLRARYHASVLTNMLKETRELAISGDYEAAFDKVKQVVFDITVSKGIDQIYSLVALTNSVLKAHDDRQHSWRLSGIPFGLPFLDEISDGAQPSDTIAIVGRPGMGKTYFLLKFALEAYNNDYVPFIVSLEMSVQQCARRLIAMLSNIPATFLRLGRLSYWGRQKLIADISELAGRDNSCYLIQGSLNSTVENIGMRIQEIHPHVAYIDGGYLLQVNHKTTARWERVSEVAEYLKALARELNIPILVTYQFNRRGPGSLGNIGHSDTIGQIASIVMSIEEDDAEKAMSWSAQTRQIAKILKGREGERGVMEVLYDMERMRIVQESAKLGDTE